MNFPRLFQRGDAADPKNEFMNFGFGEHTRLACPVWRPAKPIPSEKIGGTPILARETRALPNPFFTFYGIIMIFFYLPEPQFFGTAG